MIDSEKITAVLTLATDFHATVQAITDAHSRTPQGVRGLKSDIRLFLLLVTGRAPHGAQ